LHSPFRELSVLLCVKRVSRFLGSDRPVVSTVLPARRH
jgi:hypothetical protein